MARFLEELNFGEDQIGVVDKKNAFKLAPFAKKIQNFASLPLAPKSKTIKNYGLWQLANHAWEEYKGTRASAAERARQNKVNDTYFPPKSNEKVDNKASRAFYASADEEQKKALLHVTHGYIQSVQFSITENMVKDIHGILKSNLSEAKKRMLHEQLFPEGQKESLFGELYLSTGKIMELVSAASELLDKQVFQIFRNLSSLTQNLQGFFAGGLADNTQANNAKTSADDIAWDVEKLQTK